MFEQYTTLIGMAVQTAVFMLGGYGLLIKNDHAAKVLKIEVDDIKIDIKQLSTTVVQIAVQTERMDNMSQRVNLLDKRIEDIRRGEGLITDRG